MVTYIKNNIDGFYAEFPEPLDNQARSRIGKTFEDYLDGKWVMLNDEQIRFHKDHPFAEVSEVLNLRLDASAPVFKMDSLRADKIAEIERFDRSPEVNLFFANDKPQWWDLEKRSGLINRIDTDKRRGRKDTKIGFEDFIVTLPIEEAYKVVYAVEAYAIDCNDCTRQHIFNVRKLDDPRKIIDYDYTAGYPDKLHFSLC